MMATIVAPPAVRVSSGSDELRNLIRRRKVKSPQYRGDVFVNTRGKPLLEYAEIGRDASRKAPHKTGYAIYADPKRVVDPDPRRVQWLDAPKEMRKHLNKPSVIQSGKDAYNAKGYGVFKGGMPSSQVEGIRKIIADPRRVIGGQAEYSLGPVRDFEKLKSKYKGISRARTLKNVKSAATTAGKTAAKGALRLATPAGWAATAYDFMDNVGGLPWSDENKKPKPKTPENMSKAEIEARTGPRPNFASGSGPKMTHAYGNPHAKLVRARGGFNQK